MARVVKSVDFTPSPWHSRSPPQKPNPIIFLVHARCKLALSETSASCFVSQQRRSQVCLDGNEFPLLAESLS